MPNWTNSLKNSAQAKPKLAAALLLRAVRAARREPNAFIELCFRTAEGDPLRQAPLHRELQSFLSCTRRGLVELPRDHGKSVQVCARLVWELGRQPGLRLKLVCATDALAQERCRFLREAIRTNPRVRLVFPQLKPAQPWSASAFTIQRPASVIGPSVAAFGVGTGSTGTRADLLVCDDIVDVRSLHSVAERRRVHDYFHNNLMNLLEPDGRFWGLCTPWHGDDLNAHLKQNPAYAVYRRAIGPKLEPIWPDKWPTERLQQRLQEIGAASFARGYRLLPMAEEELLIPAKWIHFWHEPRSRAEYEQVVLAVDPAVSGKATADASALVVVGRAAKREYHCLEAVPHRVPMPELVRRLDEADRKWQPDVIVFESNAAFAGIRELLTRQARFGPKLLGVVQTRSKLTRMMALSVPLQNRSVLLKGRLVVDPSQQELFDELTTFPHGAHDDLADALALAVEYLFNRPEPRVL